MPLRLRREQFASQGKPAGQLADSLVAGEQIVHPQPHVVPGNLERACSGRP